MIVDGGTTNPSRKFHKITLTMGVYVFNIPIISITMGGVDVILGVQWLQYLGRASFNFLKFSWNFPLIENNFSEEGSQGNQQRW